MAALAFQKTTSRERERDRVNQTARIADRWTSKIAHNHAGTQHVNSAGRGFRVKLKPKTSNKAPQEG
jgi:hypothetical protein